MMKKAIGALVLASTIGVLALGTTTAKAEEVKENDNTYYVVESGDTLSKIADKYGVNFEAIHGNNTDTIEHADLIFGGQKLLVGGKDFDVNKLETYGTAVTVAVAEQPVATEPVQEAVVEQSQPVEQAQAVESTVVASDDNWHKANRRMVESTNNYNTFTGNGYLGAYQFAPSTWNSIASRHGLDASDFSPANQDRMADIYANERYGGWSNVPTTGGW